MSCHQRRAGTAPWNTPCPRSSPPERLAGNPLRGAPACARRGGGEGGWVSPGRGGGGEGGAGRGGGGGRGGGRGGPPGGRRPPCRPGPDARGTRWSRQGGCGG